MTTCRDAALAALAAGISVVPPRENGTKAPQTELKTLEELTAIGGEAWALRVLNNLTKGYTWAHWQKIRPDADKVESWYRNGRTGVGFVCGAVSGNLELLEYDDLEVYDQFIALARASGLADLMERIEAGYKEQTPGGGIHALYRVALPEGETLGGNTKLAQRPKRPEEQEDPADRIKTIIETRSEGGFVVVAPSNGKVHPTGGSYQLLRGGIEHIVTITPDEREELFALARSLDQIEKAKATQATPATTGDRPGDEYRAAVSWREVLEPHGWTLVYERGDEQYWRRPGKNRGISATTNYGGHDLLYVFSTSTDFQAERGYNKFSVYGILAHGGDFKKAAAKLYDLGYGKRDEDKASTAAPEGEPDEPPAPFPLEALPDAFRHLVAEGAASLVCPPDFIAVPLLVEAGAAIGDALELELKPGWREGANAYAAVVGDPGSKKSPAATLALRPINRIQRRMARQFDEELQEHLTALAEWEATKKAERGPRPTPPTFRHLITTDATTEAVATILQTAKGLLLFKDELTGWVRSMDQYRSGGKGADRQHYLSMWSRSLIKVDRKGNPRPIIVPRPHLSVCGGIQPDLLPDLADAAQREDGFIDRLLWSFPEKLPDRWTDDIVATATVEEAQRVFERLYALEPDVDDEGEATPSVIRLSRPAASLWAQWYGEHAAEMQAPDFPRRLIGPWAKLPAQLARLALILHALSDAALTEVTAETVAAAGDLIEYFKSHARRAYRLLGSQRRDRVVTLLQALKQRGPINQRAILHDVFKRNVSAEWLRATLEELEEAGLVAHEPQQNQTGRPGTVWRAT